MQLSIEKDLLPLCSSALQSLTDITLAALLARAVIITVANDDILSLSACVPPTSLRYKQCKKMLVHAWQFRFSPCDEGCGERERERGGGETERNGRRGLFVLPR